MQIILAGGGGEFTVLWHRPGSMSASFPTLRPAVAADAAITLSWSPDETALKRWVGPNARWPTTADLLWASITTPGFTTFALESPEHGLVGFGQVLFREEAFGHLARVIVSPHHRGQGYGRVLCRALMREALGLHPITAYSLFVYRDNAPAIALYRSLGFSEQGVHPKFDTIVLMVAPLPKAPSAATR